MKGKKKAEVLFSSIIGEKARNVQLGHGSFLTMDFGKDLLLERTVRGEKITYTQGEWHLWIIMCAWRLDCGDQSLIGSVDKRKAIEKEITIIENATLQEVHILNFAFDTVLVFENQIRLLLFSHGVQDNKQWMLLTPSRQIFRAGPGNEWNYGK